MSGQEYPGPIHDQVTHRSGFRYFFYDKHHNRYDTEDAQWLPTLLPADEFAIFDEADLREIADAKGNFFGISKNGDGDVQPLGTEQQEVAEFPFTRPPGAWHGYPMWPLKRNNRLTQPVPRAALNLMVESGWIEVSQKRRLSAGKHIS